MSTETWAVTRYNEQKTQSSEMRFLWSSLRYKLHNMVRNSDVKGELKMPSLNNAIKENVVTLSHNYIPQVCRSAKETLGNGTGLIKLNHWK